MQFTPSFLPSLAALATLVIAGAPAKAATVLVTYTGTIGDGHDTTGMFGLAGATHNNEPYTLVYTINDATPGAVYISSPTMTQIGGAGASSPVNASLTINGVTRMIYGSVDGTAQQYNEISASGLPYNGKVDKVRQVVDDTLIIPSVSRHIHKAETYISSYDQNFLSTPDYHDSLSYPGNTSTDSFYNFVQFDDFNYVTKTAVNLATFNLSGGQVTITTVPEPTNCVLVMLGFAAILNRRRSRCSSAS